MPFRPDRLKSLREVKGLSQEQLGNRAGLSHPVITKSENGKNLPRAEALDKLAQALDCTMDYLHGRGQPYENTAIAAAHMAFDVFLAQRILSEEQREMCRRVLRHRDAPKTAEAWHSFAEMLDLAITSTPNESLLFRQHPPKPQPMSVARRRHH